MGSGSHPLFLLEPRRCASSILPPEAPKSTFFLRFSITRLRSNFALINHGSGSISASPRPFLSAHQIPPAPQFRVFSDRRDDGAPLSCAAFAPENHPIGRLFLRAPTSNSEIPEFGADLYYVRPEGVGA